MKQKFPIVILISGSGSNLQAIIDNIAAKQWPIEIKAVISNNPDAYGLQRAKSANIVTETLDHRQFPDRQQYDNALIELINSYAPKLIVLAGFMRILSDQFVQQFSGMLINIHPSLLPKYKGLNTHQRAIDAGDKIHGCTVHIVSEQLDSGAILAQMQCEIAPDDSVESLQRKVHRLEHQLLPKVIFDIATRKIVQYAKLRT